MQELERMINVYHTAYMVFLILSVVFLALTIFMFFKFDIRKIIDMKTGRGAKKSIQKMEEINAQTGKLRQDVADTPSRLSPEERITYPVTAQNLQVHAAVQDNRTNLQSHAAVQDNRNQMQTSAAMGVRSASITRPQPEKSQQISDDGSQETTLLNDSSETTLLYQEDPETTVLSGNPMAAGAIKKKLPGYFHIEKEILWVHTKEVL